VIVTDDRVARFVGARVGTIIYPPFTAMGLERAGEIIGGIVFNCFTGRDIHISVAGSGWTRGFLQEAGRYVFGQLGCARVTLITEQAAVAALAHRLGGRTEGLLRDFFGPGRDGVLIGILREDYPYGFEPTPA
jgi:RimJ/RimL family protein N-acetyltransferase